MRYSVTSFLIRREIHLWSLLLYDHSFIHIRDEELGSCLHHGLWLPSARPAGVLPPLPYITINNLHQAVLIMHGYGPPNLCCYKSARPPPSSKTHHPTSYTQRWEFRKKKKKKKPSAGSTLVEECVSRCAFQCVCVLKGITSDLVPVAAW